MVAARQRGLHEDLHEDSHEGLHKYSRKNSHEDLHDDSHEGSHDGDTRVSCGRKEGPRGGCSTTGGEVVCACLARGICTTGVLHEGAGLALATNPRARDVGVYGKGWGQGGRVGHPPPPLLRAWKNKKSPLKPGNCPKSLSFEAPFGAAPPPFPWRRDAPAPPRSHDNGTGPFTSSPRRPPHLLLGTFHANECPSAANQRARWAETRRPNTAL